MGRGQAKLSAPAGEPARTVRRAISDEEKDARRAAILSAAKAVFARNGYHATTIADVAKEAELSYGSIYWYFDSKEALFHELMESEERMLKELITRALDTGAPGMRPDAPFRAAVRTVLEYFESDRALVKLLFRDSYALGDQFEGHLYRIYEGFIGGIESVLRDAQAGGLIVEAPPRMLAFSVAALISQIAQRRLVTDDGLEAGVVADFIVSLLLYGVLPRPGLASRLPGIGRAAGPGETDAPLEGDPDA